MTITEDDLVPASENPEGANAALALAQVSDPPEYPTPTDGPLDLLVGFTRFHDLKPENVSTAWVRELTGADEERIAKARGKGKLSALMEAILEGGVERLGDSKPTPAELRDLVFGDREFLLLAISSATYGDELEFNDFKCHGCGEPFSFSFSKMEDIPIIKANPGDEKGFIVPLRKGGKVLVRLTTGGDQAEAERASNDAEFNSIILSQVVLTLTLPDGEVITVSEQPDAVRDKLGVVDRQTILKELAARSPGPRFDEITVNHPDCSSENSENKVVVQFWDLFLGL